MHTIKMDGTDIAESLKNIAPTDLIDNRSIAIRLNEIIERLNRIDRMVYELWERAKQTKDNSLTEKGD